VIPGGSRVLVMFGSANRNERKWAKADEFDVARNPIDHLGFGFAIHRCAAAALSLLELEAVLAALVCRVKTMEIVGEPQRALNNALRGLHRLPLSVLAG
jgi:cytochrome P450